MKPQEISVNISELSVIYRTKKTNKERREIRDFLVTLTGFSKDYAAKLLRGNRVRTGKKTGRGPTYSMEVRNMLIELWERAGCPNTKALQARIDRFVEEFGEVRHLRPEVADRLRRMSASTMDRILRGRPRKKPGFTVRRRTPRAPSAAQALAQEISGEAIPAYLCKPGEVQVDTVALCGGDMSGNFHWILTVTDRVTLWTEIRCVWNKGAAGVFAALEDALASFPYKVRILHFDNGNEFMNAHLLAFVRRHPEYAYQRSRPRQKNDNAHVEQRNYSLVRTNFGYGRYDNRAQTEALNHQCIRISRHHNYCLPTMTLRSKTPHLSGKGCSRHYSPPITPAQRLLEHPGLRLRHRAALKRRLATLNALVLMEQITYALARLRRDATLQG